MENIEKIKTKTYDDLANYNTRAAVDAFSCSLVNLWYQGAPKLKNSSTHSYEYVRTAGYIASVNAYNYMNCLIKRAIEQGLPMEEVLGEVQLQLKNSWSALVTSKLGHTCFRPMDIKDIIEINDPYDLMKKSATFVKKRT